MIKESRIKILFHGDAVIPTGFSRVLHSIAQHLPEDAYNIAWLGINYYGDPHNYPYRIYPASLKGDIWGINRLKEIVIKEKPDILFILNDIWVTSKILNELKDLPQKPRIITYFPVDGEDFNKKWFENSGIVSKTVVYTEFGKKVVEDCGATNINLSIVPHGIATDVFYPIKKTKQEIKKLIYPHIDEYLDSFVVLNAN